MAVKKFGDFIVKHRVLVIILSVLLLIPSFIGMAKTKINYDMLEYLPQELDSMKGQQILDKTFSNAASSMLIIENMESKDILKLKEEISEIEGVDTTIWISDILDESVPKDILPDEIKNVFYSENSTMLIIKYNESASSEVTQKAIGTIRKITNEQCFLSGMSAIVKDTKDLSDKETPMYVLIAVILSVVVLVLTMESTLIPAIFLISMGFAIVFNMGTNIFLKQVSYITKSIAAVLQLGVTMDYSIFLLHRYEEEKKKMENRYEAMAEAISNTIVSISGSSLTTIAGFLALCSMKLSLGKDIGLVMAKGVVLGVLSTITILPALILTFDKQIHKYCHRTILPEFNKVSKIVSQKYKTFIWIFLIAFIPALYGNNNLKVYYNLDSSLPKDLPSIIATNKLKEDYNMTTTHFIVVHDNVPAHNMEKMIKEIEEVEGIDKVLGYNKFMGEAIPESFIPDNIRETFKKDGYNLILVNSKYKAATDEENKQIEDINSIVKSYDKESMITGEGVLTKDLVMIADKDFKSSSLISIGAIFAIILLVFKSISIPIILVLAIELAILVNMSMSFYMGTTVPFVASIVIGCIQLGATVDYAILLTSRFKEELGNGLDKFTAMEKAVKESAKSIVTSALAFFGATAGVGIISNLSIIRTLCIMMARGAIISMIVIIFILPSILLVCEGIIKKTTKGWVQSN